MDINYVAVYTSPWEAKAGVIQAFDTKYKPKQIAVGAVIDVQVW